MDVQTPKATRRSTRVRVEIPVKVTSLDRMRPFADTCMVLVVSAQGCGFRTSQPLQLETPVILSDLPNGGTVTARVANCLTLGNDGKYFLIGAALYTHGNVWGIADPPEDWQIAASIAAKSTPASSSSSGESKQPIVPTLKVNKKVWPYNLFPESQSK